MKIFISLFILVGLLFANDATIEVIKKAGTLPSLAVEDASISYDDTFRLRFFKSLVADLNVISLFNVDRHHRLADYDDTNVLVGNKDMNYVLRYKLFEDDNRALNVEIKLFNKDEEVFSKHYKVNKKIFTCLYLMPLPMISMNLWVNLQLNG